MNLLPLSLKLGGAEARRRGGVCAGGGAPYAAICMIICMYIYIYIYICIERERDLLYTYIHMHIYIYIERERERIVYNNTYNECPRGWRRALCCQSTRMPTAFW